jgi:hypothetical protein
MDKVIRGLLNASYYVNGDKLVLGNEAETGNEARTPKFIYRGKPKLKEGRYPIESFTTENASHKFLASTFQTKSRNVDPAQKEVVEIVKETGDPTLNINPARTAAWANTIPEDVKNATGDGPETFMSAYRKDNTGQRVPTSPTDPNAEEKVTQVKRHGEQMGGIHASWDTPGNPRFKPIMVSRVFGTILYDGPYYLKTVQHRGDMSGYASTISGFTTGFNTSETELVSYLQKQGGTVPSDGDTPSGSGDTQTKTPR